MVGQSAQQVVLPRPGKVLRAVMVLLFVVWLVFALAINWAGVSMQPFAWLTISTPEVLSGQVWRLLTAGLVHHPQTVSHILWTEVGLFFLAPSLEESWGGRRFLRFIVLSAVLSYATQVLLTWALPASLSVRVAPSMAFGAMPVVEAIAIAWACSFKGRKVNLFFVLPVSSRGLILFVVGFSLLTLVAGEMSPSGHIALFAGMAFGWLLGGGTPSPLRRLYLTYRLGRLEDETRRDGAKRRRKAKEAGFRVISGGRDRRNDDTLH